MNIDYGKRSIWTTYKTDLVQMDPSQKIKFLSFYIIPISVDDVNIVNDPLCSLSYHANPRIFKKFWPIAKKFSIFREFRSRLTFWRIFGPTNSLIWNPDSPSRPIFWNFLSFFDWYHFLSYQWFFRLITLVIISKKS